MIETEFYVTNISRCEDRSNKKEVDSTSVYMVDFNKKDMNEKNWTPVSSLNINLVGQSDSGLEFGKKYKVTFTEVK